MWSLERLTTLLFLIKSIFVTHIFQEERGLGTVLFEMSGETDIALWVYGMGYMGWHTTLWGLWRKHATLLVSYTTLSASGENTTFLASGENIPCFWLLEKTYHVSGFRRKHTTLWGFWRKHTTLWGFWRNNTSRSASRENMPRFGLLEKTYSASGFL